MTKTPTTQVKTSYRFDDGTVTIAYDCPQNCKLSYVSGLQFLGILPGEKQKQKFDQLLKELRIAVYLNTPVIAIKDWIINNYEVYSCSEIPIGYSGNYQYHIIIRNPTGQPNNNMRPTEFKPLEKRKQEAKPKILKLLKENKRKTDLIDKMLELV